jgi:hypothetical protein
MHYYNSIIMDKELSKIFNEAKMDPELLFKMDPDEFLRKMQKENNSYLQDKTNAIIMKEIQQSLEDEFENIITKKEKLAFIKKLLGYRLVDELDKLHFGKHVRWIQKYNEEIKMTNGGILVNMSFTNEGTNLVIRLWNGTIIQIRFDDCLIYQKLSYDEQLILMASDYVNR